MFTTGHLSVVPSSIGYPTSMDGNKSAERKEYGPTVREIRLSQYAFIIHVIKITHNVPQAKKGHLQ